MSQQYCQIVTPPHGWIVGGPESATQVLLLQQATVRYTDGTSDTLPALTPAVVQATGALTVDRTVAVWCPYTVKGSGALSVIKESDLGTLTSDYAVLGRVSVHEVLSYQPDAYLTGPLGRAAAQTITVLSATTARALSLWNGSGNNAPPANWQAQGFNDSGWSRAVVAGTNSNDTQPGGSTPVWSTASAAAAAEQTLIRQSIVLPAGIIASAMMQIRCDDGYEVLSVNGIMLGSRTTTLTAGVLYTDVYQIPANALQVGQSNVIAAWGANGIGAGAYVSFALSVSFVPTGGMADSTTAEGDIAYRHNGQLSAIPIGANGAVLTSNGTDPVWTAPPLSSSGIDAPLVNGDLPGPALMADGAGQCIMVQVQ